MGIFKINDIIGKDNIIQSDIEKEKIILKGIDNAISYINNNLNNTVFITRRDLLNLIITKINKLSAGKISKEKITERTLLFLRKYNHLEIED